MLLTFILSCILFIISDGQIDGDILILGTYESEYNWDGETDSVSYTYLTCLSSSFSSSTSSTNTVKLCY